MQVTVQGRGRKKGPPAPEGYVYYVLSPVNRLVKIGFTKQHPSLRFAALQSGSPLPLLRWGCMRGDLADERMFHDLATPYHWRGEWFGVGGTLLDLLDRLHGTWPSGMFGPTDFEFIVHREHAAGVAKGGYEDLTITEQFMGVAASLHKRQFGAFQIPGYARNGRIA